MWESLGSRAHDMVAERAQRTHWPRYISDDELPQNLYLEAACRRGVMRPPRETGEGPNYPRTQIARLTGGI
jgi:hypothetical protein